MYNKTILYGRITRDPKIIKSNKGYSLCYITLAINNTSDHTDFISVKVEGKTADNLCKYQRKGSLILVEGKNISYKTEKDNKTEYKQEIVATKIIFSDKGRGYEIDEIEKEQEVKEFTYHDRQAPVGYDNYSADGELEYDINDKDYDAITMY